jgi:hypothetical protein
MIPGSANPLLLATAAAGGYTISRSLRFNSSDSAYLSRTPSASSTNRKASTYAFWMKLDCRNSAGTQGSNTVLSCYDNVGPYALYWNFLSEANGRKLSMSLGGASDFGVTFAPSFRDPSSWYHVVIVIDTDNATNSDRIRLYVNGTRVTATSSASWPTQGYQPTTFISGRNTNIGVDFTTSYANYFNGLLADIYFIDGQALDPTSFGEFSATTGVWMPKAFTGSYGTNGFKLDFADNSAATAAALGKDTSGNGNNFTPTNLSVTAGAGNDSLIDVPVNGSQTDTGVGGEVRGNYATLNPLAGSGTLANGNLDISGTFYRTSTIGLSSGKWYWEITIGSVVSNSWLGLYLDPAISGGNFVIIGTGNQYTDAGGTFSVTSGSLSLGDVFGIAANFDTGTITWYKNGSTAVVLTGATLNTKTWLPGCHVNASATTNWTFNAGARPFAYTAPSGFKALCTANLPAPTIVKPSTVMDVVLYTGTGSTLTPTSSLGFSPDLVWIKSRSAATDHTLYDAVRGAQARLESNNTDAEVTSDNGLTAFNSAGFTLGTLAQVNTNAATYAAWTWDAGSSTVTNTAGTITSSVRANASAGFSVVTFTYPSSGSFTAGHGLGVAPSLIITKHRNRSSDWYVYHMSATSTNQYLVLNSTAAVGSATDVWGTAAPTSTVFGGKVGTSGISGDTEVAYCFAPVAGYSSFGSYTGNGSADGPFVYTGFRPRWILLKRSVGAIADWVLHDTARSDYNVASKRLYANSSAAEVDDSTMQIDCLSNGFKLRSSGGNVNQSTDTYIYAAFAESPFQYSRAR